jgi:SAM-dependent methyltransferase
MPPRGLSRSILTRQEARDLYNRFSGSRGDFAFYARPAVDRLVEHGDFKSAAAVVEFGCGTGALAQRLMEQVLPIYAGYSGFDLAENMVQKTRQRLVPFGARVSVTRTDGRPRVPLPPHSCDRFVSTYVLDLMASQDIAKLLGQAWTVLRPGGLLCLANLSFGTTPLSKLVMNLWQKLHASRPAVVGGCRPIAVSSYLGPASWKILYQSTVISKGVPTEILIARPRAHAEPGVVKTLER